MKILNAYRRRKRKKKWERNLERLYRVLRAFNYAIRNQEKYQKLCTRYEIECQKEIECQEWKLNPSRVSIIIYKQIMYYLTPYHQMQRKIEKIENFIETL